MSYSLIRLTLYGLLSSLEADLRSIIRSQLLEGKPSEGILSPQMQEKIIERASKDGLSDLSDAIDYLDFADSHQILSAKKNLLDPLSRQMVRDRSVEFERLAPIRNRVMHSRPLRFDDASSVFNLTKLILKNHNALFPTLVAMERRLGANPDYALTLELPRSGPETTNTATNLPIPDFDETGFLGRQAEVSSLLRALKGPYPVISVLGEGGVGKTALVLQAAYEILDDQTQDYQAIVWTSSKTTRLTVSEVQKIEGAIEDSLGIFRDVSENLGGRSTLGTLDEVLEYLNSFKILLILDNLETVLDENIRKFLYGLSGSSKVLITSRVGIGELNYTFPLRGLGNDDARQLLRATAHARRVSQLSQASNNKLDEYCSRMKNNPAFMKWFVTAVQCGKRPEEVLARPEIFLDFCLSNVYEYLENDAILIANALLSVPGQHAQPVISYLTNLDGDQFQAALRSLITTNMVIMGSVSTGGGVETVYELGDLPRLYLTRHHPPTSEDVAIFQGRRREIVATHERLAAANLSDRYNPNTIALRSRDDSVVAKYLLEALAKVRNKIFGEALFLIERAKQLAPGYFEVYRVEGWAHSFAGNLPAARAAYEIAVEIEPKSAPLRYWYGGFLLRSADDAEAAEDQFSKAVELDDVAPALQAELGRSRMYLGKFQEADDAFRRAYSNEKVPERTRRVAYDGWLQTSVRSAEKYCELGEYLGSLRALETLCDKLAEIDQDCIDSKIIGTIAKGAHAIQRLMGGLSRIGHLEQGQKVAAEISDHLQNFRNRSSVQDNNYGISDEDISTIPLGNLAGKVLMGSVNNIVSDKKYGFISIIGGERIFFHASDLVGASFSEIKLGQEVKFIVRSELETDRFRAVDIVVIPRSGHVTPRDEIIFGVIKVYGVNGNFGFVFSDSGKEYFFHKTNLDPKVSTRDLIPGARVNFKIGRNAKGEVATDLRIVH